MRKFLLLLLLPVLVLLMVIAYKSLTFKSMQIERANTAPAVVYDSAAVQRFSKSIQLPTVSYDNGQRDTAAFLNMLALLDESFPLVKQRMWQTTVNNFTRLYKWEGSDTTLRPALLYAHYDVVPIETTSMNDWKHAPFSGDVDAEFVWGRGAIDDKIGVMAALEAAEKALQQGFIPKRTIWLVLGHDEETGGLDGAAAAAAFLDSVGVKTEFHLDEGGLIGTGIVPNMQAPVALVGTAEKGYMTLKLTVNINGGHSSKPARETAIGVLTRAVNQLQQHPFPKVKTAAVHDFIQHVGPEMPEPLRTVFANDWLFAPIILSVYEKSAEGNAMIRTTTVPTVFNAGIKENLIPGTASVLVNCRLLTGESAAAVKQRIAEIINDPRVIITESENTFEASGTTSAQSFGFQLIQKVCAQVYPEAVVTPYLDIGSTDSKHFEKLGGNVLRFLPVNMNSEILGTFHGVNERVKVNDYLRTVAFYHSLLTML